MTMHNMHRGANVRIFPYTNDVDENNHQYQQQENQPAAEAASSSTTTMQKLPIFDRCARQSLAVEELKKEFQDAFGRVMPRAIAEQVLRDIRAGVPAAYYRYAIEQTMYAPRPSWRYTMAIIARLQRTMAAEEDMDFRG